MTQNKQKVGCPDPKMLNIAYTPTGGARQRPLLPVALRPTNHYINPDRLANTGLSLPKARQSVRIIKEALAKENLATMLIPSFVDWMNERAGKNLSHWRTIEGIGPETITAINQALAGTGLRVNKQ